ncbi:MAG: single-stranded DNA-binding protein [Chloroflexi bacterium]|nr:single-stranded DNA-binding protein [Chloroflexota bacterium]
MSRGLNKVMIIGHLGRDPEMRYTPSGRPVTTFSVATTRNWNTADGERRQSTEWFNVVAWGSLAEICKEHLLKGQQVYIEGRLQTRRWEDEEHNKRQSTEIVAREMVMLGGRKKRPEGEEAAEHEDAFSSEEDGPDNGGEDEFPF